MRSALAALACVLACACAKAPDATTTPKASADGAASAGLDAGAGAEAGRSFGLPMPQIYPRFVWDAAAADASSRDEHGR